MKVGDRQTKSITANVCIIDAEAGSSVTVYNQQFDSSQQSDHDHSASRKHDKHSAQDTDSDSATWSWNSRESKRRKIKHIYLNSYYGMDSSETAAGEVSHMTLLILAIANY